jgi:GGDEF domain-containing protein
MAYSYRNALHFTLMFVKLRYEAEFKKILSNNQYNDLKQKLAVILEDSIRLEDKIYAIDDKGSIALMLTCDSSGAAIIKQRIKNILISKATFDGIADRPIRVETNIAYLQYSKEHGKLSAMEFIQKVESELQYDV